MEIEEEKGAREEESDDGETRKAPKEEPNGGDEENTKATRKDDIIDGLMGLEGPEEGDDGPNKDETSANVEIESHVLQFPSKHLLGGFDSSVKDSNRILLDLCDVNVDGSLFIDLLSDHTHRFVSDVSCCHSDVSWSAGRHQIPNLKEIRASLQQSSGESDRK